MLLIIVKKRDNDRHKFFEKCKGCKSARSELISWYYSEGIGVKQLLYLNTLYFKRGCICVTSRFMRIWHYPMAVLCNPLILCTFNATRWTVTVNLGVIILNQCDVEGIVLTVNSTLHFAFYCLNSKTISSSTKIYSLNIEKKLINII